MIKTEKLPTELSSFSVIEDSLKEQIKITENNVHTLQSFLYKLTGVDKRPLTSAPITNEPQKQEGFVKRVKDKLRELEQLNIELDEISMILQEVI